MKKLLTFTILLMLLSCNSSYENEELKAIQDISNDYLYRQHLKKILNPINYEDDKDFKKPIIDTLKLKVYLSDALIPISQIKEDNEWMFINNDFSLSDSIIFYNIVKSNDFSKLKYREYDKSKISLIKPYKQFNKIKGQKKTDEEYSLLSFSRICFDYKKENGVVVIDYGSGSDTGFRDGYNMVLLIKKANNKWTFVSKR